MILRSNLLKGLLFFILLLSLNLFFYRGGDEPHSDPADRVLQEEMGKPGEPTSYLVEGMEFTLRLAPARSFPVGTRDEESQTVERFFLMGETPVTYGLWLAVYEWGQENGYIFANEGRQGSNYGVDPVGNSEHPVTTINWRDCIVWCNALSHYLGLEPVYTYEGEPIYDATDAVACDVAVQEEGSGFRLPTSCEWELAARYRGADSAYGAVEYPTGSHHWWTPGNYASGAEADHTNTTATMEAAWYEVNSGGQTQEVGQKPFQGNGLGLYDMSGNVWEWCFTKKGSGRISRGGSWNYFAGHLQVGFSIHDIPGNAYYNFGFRLAKNP